MPGAPLELHEREEIFRALVEDPAAGWAAIGRRVGRHPTTVAREVRRGGGCYGPATAQRRADRQRRRPRARRLLAPGPLRDRITAELRLGRSPEAIRAEAGHWEAERIIGAHNRSSMIWLTERRSRYLTPVTMPDGYTADAVPAHLRRSLTFDRGSE